MEYLSLFISIITLLVSLISLKFSFNGQINIVNIILSCLLFITGLYGIAHYVINYSRNVDAVTFMLNNFTPFFVTTGPLIYLYIKKTLEDKVYEITIKEILYFLIPFLIIIIDLLPHFTSSYKEKKEIANLLLNNINKYKGSKHLYFTDMHSTLIRQSSNLIFISISLINVIRTNITKSLNKKQKIIVLNFLYFINIAYFLFSLLLLVNTISTIKGLFFIPSNFISLIIYNTAWIINAIIIFIILFIPSILYNLPQGFVYEEKEIFKKESIKKYKNYSLDSEHIMFIKNKLGLFLTKIPQGEDFKLSTLTIETKIPAHHLNLYFKEELKTTFTTWKNKHKLKYAIQLINDGSLNNLTIEGIAIKAGFPTYSNFYNIFKEELNQTPSEYLHSINKLGKN